MLRKQSKNVIPWSFSLPLVSMVTLVQILEIQIFWLLLFAEMSLIEHLFRLRQTLNSK